MTEGALGNPETEYYMEATPENPAVMIQLFEQEEDGYWEATRLYTACAMSLYVKIDPLQTEPEMDSEMGMAMYDASIGKAKKPNYGEMIKPRRGGSTPADPKLYARVVQAAKDKFDVYPSAVANSWVVQEYKRRGGTYKSDSMPATKSIWDGSFDPKGFMK